MVRITDVFFDHSQNNFKENVSYLLKEIVDVFNVKLQVKMAKNSVGAIDRLCNVNHQLKNKGYNPSAWDLVMIDKELSKSEKVTDSKLEKLWLEKYAN